MDIRDLFAAAALCGIIAGAWQDGFETGQVCSGAYEIADEMLRVREERERMRQEKRDASK